MHKLKRIVFYIMLISFIIKANECYGMETNENKGGEKTVMEKIKALPYPKIFIYGNKIFFSLAHSIINNFYELETLEMNKVYSLKKYLCWGYRLQPTSLAPFSFLDFNVNILGGIIDTAIFLYLYRSSGIKTPSKIFYSLTSFLNINLNIRIKSDFYIAINILGLMRAIFMPFIIKNNNKNENDNNLDNNLSNNNLGDNNENNILNNYKENNINEYNNNQDVKNGNNINEYNNNLNVKKENDILNKEKGKNIDPEKNTKENIISKDKTDENKNHNNINLDVNNKILNQENNNNNQENNNEDKLVGEKNLEKPNKNDEGNYEERVDKMYEELDEEYGISGFKDEDEVKEKIREMNFNRKEIVKWMEQAILNN